MRQFNCVSGSSFTDVCLNTYASLDNYVKMLNDNGVSPDDIPHSGQQMQWDETIVVDSTVETITTKNNIIFATLNGYISPEQINPSMSTYKDARSISYAATNPAGETLITITALQGCEIVQIEKEIKPLRSDEFTFNQLTGVIDISMSDDGILMENESLFIIYKVEITV